MDATRRVLGWIYADPALTPTATSSKRSFACVGIDNTAQRQRFRRIARFRMRSGCRRHAGQRWARMTLRRFMDYDPTTGGVVRFAVTMVIIEQILRGIC